MKLKNSNEGIELHYYFNAVDDFTGYGTNTGYHNVSRSYREGQGPTSVVYMTHDDAVSDIRDKTQNGFDVIEF